jgi:hypothetical protein
MLMQFPGNPMNIEVRNHVDFSLRNDA